MNGRIIHHALAGVGILVLLGGIALVVQYCSGCAMWQHEDVRQAAEFGCIEKYKTREQIEACREVVQNITSKYAKDAGAKDAAGE